MVLDARGHDTSAHDYQNMLAHWLSFQSVAKLAMNLGLYPPPAEVALLSKRSLPKERAAFHARKLVNNKRLRKLLNDCLRNDPRMRVNDLQPSAKDVKAFLWNRREELAQLSSAKKAGLVLP